MVKKVEYKNGSCLAYAEYGDQNGYPILVHHGLIGTIEHPELEDSLDLRGIRLVFIARPGYGESSMCDMADYTDWVWMISALLKALSIDCFDLFGISEGSPYCYVLAALMPDKVKQIYIFNGLPALYDDEVLGSYPLTSSVRRESELYRRSRPGVIALKLYHSYIAPMPEEILAMKSFTDSTAYACLAMAREVRMQYSDWGFDLSQVKQQVFMRYYDSDHDALLQAALKTARLLPWCIIRKFTGTAHKRENGIISFLQDISISIRHFKQAG